MKGVNIMVIEILQKRLNFDISLMDEYVHCVVTFSHLLLYAHVCDNIHFIVVVFACCEAILMYYFQQEIVALGKYTFKLVIGY